MKNQNLIEFGTSSCGIREHVENIRKWAHRWLRLGWLQVWETFNFSPSHVHTSAESAPCKAPISPLLGPAWPSAASHLPLAFTYLRTFPIWWRRYVQIMFPTLEANLQASCYFVYFGTWFLRSLLRFFLLCFSSLTSEGWWLTLWLVTDIWWHCARGDHSSSATLVLVHLFHCSLAPVSEHPCISKSFIQILRLQFCRAGLPAAVAALAFLATCWPYDQDAPTYPNGDLTLLFNATYATRILNEHSYISIHAILLIVKFHTCHPYMPFCAPLGCHMAMKAWKVGHDVGCPRTPRTQLSYGPATGCFGSDDRDISWLYQFTMGASLHNNLDFNWLHAPAAQPDGTVPAEWIWENQRTCNIRAT